MEDIRPHHCEIPLRYIKKLKCFTESAVVRHGLARPDYHKMATPPAPIKHQKGRQPEQIGVRLQRRLHQDEVAIAGDQVILDLPVASALRDLLAHQMAQIGGQRRRRIRRCFRPGRPGSAIAAAGARARASIAGSEKVSGAGAAMAGAAQQGQQQQQKRAAASFGGLRRGGAARRRARASVPTG